MCQLKSWNSGLVGDELNCNVLFFAHAADAVGCKEQSMAIPQGTTVSELFDIIALEHPQFETLKECCAVAMNLQMCCLLSTCDEIAGKVSVEDPITKGLKLY